MERPADRSPPPMPPSDADLVAAARNGDRRAFAALAERHYALLLATCRRAAGDPEVAADAAQEAVVTAMLGLDRLRSGDRFGAWLVGIGLNIWIGILDADALVGQLEAVELPRPGAYHFAAALLRASGGAVAEVRVSRLVEHTFYATALLADGSEVDARPSDAFGLALVTGAPIAVEPAVLESTESLAGLRPEFAAEVSGPHDGASVLAAEVRERLAEKQRELEELNEPGASPP